MPSVFAFFRARGIAGSYVVGIQLDILPTESASVAIKYHYGDYHWQTSINKEHEKGCRQLYRIEPIGIGDIILIHIRDTQLRPWQSIKYTAVLDGFTISKDSYFEDSHDYGVITLNEITVIDCDKDDVVIEQPAQVVDALPVTQPTQDRKDTHATSKKSPRTHTRKHHVRHKPIMAEPNPFASW